jgi:serine/threonine-protein kinase
VIDGIFRVERQLGGGAAGDVFAVSIIREWKGFSAGTIFCLKWYKSEMFKREPSANVIVRRVREAQIGGKIEHPNLVRAYDTSEYWADGEPRYLLMDLIDGPTLDEYVKTKSVVPSDQIRTILLEVASGLKALHEHNIIHRDVKAANVAIPAAGKAVLLDLGVVRPATEQTITDSQQFLGTLRYAAPEWLFREECTFASDVYSLGTILYLLLTGKDVYPEIRIYTRLVVAIRQGQVAFPETRPDSLHWYLCNLAKRMLEKLPGERPSLDEVIRLAGDIDLFRTWELLTESGLMATMPDYCHTDTEWQRKLTKAVKASFSLETLREIAQQKDRNKLLSAKDVRRAAGLISMSEYIEEYLELPTDQRLTWIERHFKEISNDRRLNLGQQIEGCAAFVEKIYAAEPSDEIRKTIEPLLNRVKQDENDMWATMDA